LPSELTEGGFVGLGAFLETRRDGDTLSGARVPREIGGRTVWIQVAENLAHRDALTDDIVADFFKHVGWITLPILLLLLVIDIMIFRRALHPLLRAWSLVVRHTIDRP